MSNGSSFELSGKLALITGGGTGLGIGMTKAFTEAGAKVIITGRREGILKSACEKLSGKADYIVNDVTELDMHPGLVEEIEANHGAIDTLVNNAGINLKKHVLDVTDEEIEKLYKPT